MRAICVTSEEMPGFADLGKGELGPVLTLGSPACDFLSPSCPGHEGTYHVAFDWRLHGLSVSLSAKWENRLDSCH